MGRQEIVGILISLTAIASYINDRYIRLPRSIGLTVITLLLSLLIAGSSHLGWDLEQGVDHLLEELEFNETFLHGMLSFLLFAGALHVNIIELAKYKTIIALLATVSVALSTLIIGCGTYFLTRFLGIEISLYYCLVFGALISPTDPIAVLGILKTVNTPKSLEMKITGEALFNDGMSIVLFVMLLGLATGAHDSWSPVDIVASFVRQGVGGILLGLLLGWIASYFLKNVEHYESAIMLTLALVTGGYTFADSIADVSGPICMVIAGLVVGSSMQKSQMSSEALQRLDSFWGLLDEVLNAILFVLIGLEFLRMSFNVEVILAAVGVIVIAIASRWISVAIPVGWLSMFRRFSPEVVLLMTWGGLRGGISIALALGIPQSPMRDFVVSITYAVVLFSIVIQGLTMGPLVRKIIKREKEQGLKTSGPVKVIPLNIIRKPLPFVMEPEN